jgi:dihydroxyacetone kinase
MTRVFDDPARFMDDMVEGFCKLHSDYVTRVSGGVVRSDTALQGKVAVVVGGGSGHYPAFCGVVGPGFADGAVIGNVFTSPSAQDAVNVGAAADNGGGVVITSGNYAGDVLHFTEAAETLTKNGVEARVVFVTDDIASAPRGEESKRRGIAGDFVVFKVMGAAAEAGYDLDQVVAVGEKANDRTRTMGVAFSGCTLPGSDEPLFTVPEGKMGVGLGIHGEPGIAEEDIPPAQELAQQLVDATLAELDWENEKRVGVILNGLGGSKYEELFVLWKSVGDILEEKGLRVIDPEVGELVTSLDMAGLSLTLVSLDDELESFWTAPADTPAYKKGSWSGATREQTRREIRKLSVEDHSEIVPPTEKSREYAIRVLAMLQTMRTVLTEAEDELGRIDAVAGDGDHGRGMVKGILAAVEAAESAVNQGAGVEQTLEWAGEEWSAKAGGTSGALWGAALRHAGASLGNRAEAAQPSDVLAAIESARDAIVSLGKASLGDKTMVDSLSPFVDALRGGLESGSSLAEAWERAAAHSTQAALETATLVPKVGRARPLGEKSVGTPDAGATSMAMVLNALTEHFSGGQSV